MNYDKEYEQQMAEAEGQAMAEVVVKVCNLEFVSAITEGSVKNMGIKDLREQAEIHHLGAFDPEWARLTLEKLPEAVK